MTELEQVHQTAECLFDEKAVEQAIARCATEAAEALQAQSPLLLVVMNGGLTFADRLLAHWDFPLELDYIHFTRYDGATRGGKNKTIALPRTPLKGRNVAVIDDIFDEGLTLQDIVLWAREQGAASVTSMILADKQHNRKQTSYRPDYVALDVEDKYVYGYGMDYKGWMRNKRGIYAVAKEFL